MRFITKQSPKPWKHQTEALLKAYNKPAFGFFMDMGTGKSRTAIDEIVNQDFDLTLILCPKNVVSVWPLEFKKWATVPVQVVPVAHSDTKKCVEMLENIDYSKKTVIVINYERITPRARKSKKNPEVLIRYSEIGEMLMDAAKSGHIDAIYCDESHKIKSNSSDVSKFVYRMGKFIPIRRCLTGTPMADKPTDIFGQYRFLDDTIFGGSYEKFIREYCITDEPGSINVVDYQHNKQETFKELMQSISYTVKSEDVQDLPDYHHLTRYCEMNERASKEYLKLEKELVLYVKEIDDHIVLSNVLSTMLRLQQITSGILAKTYYVKTKTGTIKPKTKTVEIDNAKATELKLLMKELGRKEPIVIFYRYNHDLRNIIRVCKHLGKKLAKQNGKYHQWEQFEYGSKYDVIAVNIKSGGAGISLTRARHHIFYSVGLSNADYRQSLKRGHRPGQNKTVFYHHLVVKDTMDERIKKLLTKKGATVDRFIKSDLVKDVIRDYQQSTQV